jgi:hypothetical protein
MSRLVVCIGYRQSFDVYIFRAHRMIDGNRMQTTRFAISLWPARSNKIGGKIYKFFSAKELEVPGEKPSKRRR